LSVTIIGLNYQPETTGNAPYTSSLAEGLQSRGWETHVITTFPHYPTWRLPSQGVAWSASSAESGVLVDRKLHYVPGSPRGYRRLLSEVSFGLRALAARWGQPDVVLLVSPALFASVFGLIRAKFGFRRTPVVLWVQDIYTVGLEETAQGGKLVTGVVRRVERWLMRNSDEVVVIHERFAEVLSERVGVAAGPLSVVRNWTHLPELPPVDRDAVRRTFGWSPSDVVVLHAGNMGVKQGLENVVEAARLSVERSSPVRFVLLGGGSERDRLIATAGELASIDFLETLEEERYQAAMASADILLVNEKSGVASMAVPSKLTSYFSSGRPVLAATDPGSITESEVKAAGAGVVVAADDPTALLREAEALGADPARAGELGARGRAFRRANLAEEAGIERYAQVLTAHAVRGNRKHRSPRSRSRSLGN